MAPKSSAALVRPESRPVVPTLSASRHSALAFMDRTGRAYSVPPIVTRTTRLRRSPAGRPGFRSKTSSTSARDVEDADPVRADRQRRRIPRAVELVARGHHSRVLAGELEAAPVDGVVDLEL